MEMEMLIGGDINKVRECGGKQTKLKMEVIVEMTVVVQME